MAVLGRDLFANLLNSQLLQTAYCTYVLVYFHFITNLSMKAVFQYIFSSQLYHLWLRLPIWWGSFSIVAMLHVLVPVLQSVNNEQAWLQSIHQFRAVDFNSAW